MKKIGIEKSQIYNSITKLAFRDKLIIVNYCSEYEVIQGNHYNNKLNNSFNINDIYYEEGNF